MAIYSWPAILERVDNGEWVTSLIDWPEIKVNGPTAQASALNASVALSNMVRVRIDRGLELPLPSELKPDQIHIFIDADASTRLEAYPNEKREQQRKIHLELAQANRERRAGYLTEHHTNLTPVQNLQDHTNRGAIEFALVGVRSIYILNGGALIAIPAILQFAENGRVLEGSLILAVIMFVTGIALSALTNFFGYSSMYIASGGHGNEIDARVIDVSDLYYPPADPSPNQVEVATLRDKARTQFAQAQTLEKRGVVTFILAVSVFIIGVGIIIYGLQARPVTPPPVAPPAIEYQPLDLS